MTIRYRELKLLSHILQQSTGLEQTCSVAYAQSKFTACLSQAGNSLGRPAVFKLTSPGWISPPWTFPVTLSLCRRLASTLANHKRSAAVEQLSSTLAEEYPAFASSEHATYCLPMCSLPPVAEEALNGHHPHPAYVHHENKIINRTALARQQWIVHICMPAFLSF